MFNTESNKISNFLEILIRIKQIMFDPKLFSDQEFINKHKANFIFEFFKMKINAADGKKNRSGS